MFIGSRLLRKSSAYQGLCSICLGEGGPCKSCNGLGVIVETTKGEFSKDRYDFDLRDVVVGKKFSK